jgi:NADPH:quinone reductase-like Zn-dependent oxidoreductase
LNTLLVLLNDGNAEGKKTAKEELKKMASLADRYAAAVSNMDQQIFRVVFPVGMKSIIDNILKDMKEEGKVITFTGNTEQASVHYEITFANLFSLYEFGWNQREHFDTKGQRQLYSF